MATKSTQYKPAHLNTVTACLTIQDAGKAIEFYKKAFGAEELMCFNGPDGKLMHGEIKIGDSVIFLGDEYPEMGKLGPIGRGGATSSLMVYFENVDAAFKKAVDAGCKVEMPLGDMFWGDRWACVVDPYGQVWSLAQHIEDVDGDEMKKRMEASCKEMAAAAQAHAK